MRMTTPGGLEATPGAGLAHQVPDFFTRLGGSQAAVMEVECASRGESRCRFLVGSPDMLTYVYERMTTGLSYAEALA